MLAGEGSSQVQGGCYTDSSGSDFELTSSAVEASWTGWLLWSPCSGVPTIPQFDLLMFHHHWVDLDTFCSLSGSHDTPFLYFYYYLHMGRPGLPLEHLLWVTTSFLITVHFQSLTNSANSSVLHLLFTSFSSKFVFPGVSLASCFPTSSQFSRQCHQASSLPSSPHIQSVFHHRVKFPSFSHRSGKCSGSDICTLHLKWTISLCFSNCCSQCPNSMKWLFFPSAWWTGRSTAMSEIRGRRRRLKWAELSQGYREEALW